MGSNTFVEVVFPLPLNRAFHYRLPAGDSRIHQVLGARVLAPFGKKKKLIGYVVGKTSEAPSFPTKEIIAWVDPESFIDEPLLDLARWLSGRYLCSLGEALACIVPPHLSPPKRERTASSEQKAGKAAPGSPLAARRSLTLNAEQNRALDRLFAAVDANQFHPFLLRGITDSGKTELYVRTIERVLKQGRQAIFLLPEIALTPPFIEKLRARFPERGVALWHSGIAGAERYRVWSGAKQGRIDVLLGARSAVFAPFPRLGVIVMDEEHEPSYKQEDRPRYHTREVALYRARQSQAVLIMGSATPSLESYWNAKEGVYTLLALTSRVEQRLLPPVTLLDRRSALHVSSPPVGEEKGGGTPHPCLPPQGGKVRARGPAYGSVFSEPLKLAIEQRLAKREQVMLFVNRRGYTPFLRCSACGWVARCGRCSTTLALHLKNPLAHRQVGEGGGEGTSRGEWVVPDSGQLQCHACLHQEPVPIQCPSCKGMRLHHYGVGTQRVEQELKRLFPFVKTARLDRDIASSRHVYERVYRDFAGGDIDVLVGTQMIAKGFDFPNVTLVGVVDADVSLHLPDFRSAERTFQLIAQVAGRTGRGKAGGKVLVQTHHPDHYGLQAAQAHDYLDFYDQEIGYRQSLRYPPFCRLVNVLIRGNKEPVVQKMADDLYQKLAAMPVKGVDLLGPSPAPYSRLRNQFRYQIVLKGADETLGPYLSFLRHYRSPKAFVSVDVDPNDLL